MKEHCNIRIIPLTRQQFAIVDAWNYESLNQYKWCAYRHPISKNYYAVRMDNTNPKKQKTIRMHREIMNTPSNSVVDHINHNTTDNREINLRNVTQRQNMQNLKHEGTSKYPGVYWQTSAKKWRSQIKINGISKYLGLFENERDAAIAYESALREYAHQELVCKMEGA